VWWQILVIPALRRVRQESCQFKVSLGFIANPASKRELEKGHVAGTDHFLDVGLHFSIYQAGFTVSRMLGELVKGITFPHISP
jgi:hypothetical protein